jgi:cytochrome c peroxidase
LKAQITHSQQKEKKEKTMKKKTVVVAAIMLFLCAGTASQAAADLREQAVANFKPIPTSPPELKGNPATPDKLELGKVLYFDPRLSKSALISCHTCHNVGLGGGDFQETSTGHNWQKGPRNAPTVLNSVFNIAQFWDGRAKDLAEQAKGPIQAGVEMANTPDGVLKTLNSMPEYITLFQKAFPGEKNPVSFDNMAKAIEVFEATLLTPNSPFDRFLSGDKDALSPEATLGLQAFMEKGCVDCHSGVNIGGTDYFNFGVQAVPPAAVMAGDKGRFAVTKTKSDEYVFKSPSLRNIEITGPYFHSGKIWGLKEAVAIMGSSQLGVTLTDKDIDPIVAFLKATTGEQPKIVHPTLPKPTDSTPRPALN